MSKILHRVSDYLSNDAPWSKTMAVLVTFLTILIFWFVGVVTFQTIFPADKWQVTSPLSVESFRVNNIVTIKYSLGIDASEDFSGRFDNQLSCDSGAADILDSMRDIKRGESIIVRHSLIPSTIKQGDACTLELGVTRDAPFSLSRSRRVISRATFVIK